MTILIVVPNAGENPKLFPKYSKCVEKFLKKRKFKQNDLVFSDELYFNELLDTLTTADHVIFFTDFGYTRSMRMLYFYGKKQKSVMTDRMIDRKALQNLIVNGNR